MNHCFLGGLASIFVMVASLLRPAWAVDARVETLGRLLPATPTEFARADVERIREAARRIDAWVGEQAWALPEPPEQVLDKLRHLAEMKRDVGALVEQMFGLRGGFAALPHGVEDREPLRRYLRVMSCLIDLEGRMRYALRDAIDHATWRLDPYPTEFDRLIDIMTEYRSGIAATVFAYVLFDPPSDSDAVPFPTATKVRVLRLIAASRDPQLIGVLAEFLNEPGVSAPLALRAALAVRELGLPQAPLERLENQQQDTPALTPDDFLRHIEQIDPQPLSAEERSRWSELRDWARLRAQRGLEAGELRWGAMTVRPGDWLLMRNPSPYNRFTDLEPGLFTHVGIVTETRDDQGVRRLVVVDLPERGTHIPAENVDVYLARTLHYVFLRHPDERVAKEMAAAAAALIGNPSQFDLSFQTNKVDRLRGQPLRGKKIETYCAGLLLICAQAAGRNRAEFFPIEEYPASPDCRRNMERLGLRLGDRFVSPTGALFSPTLQLVGRREPMYDPGREIKETIYDHFAQRMATCPLRVAPDLLQSLRLEAARLSRSHPWLAAALARMHDVSPDIDLEAAARAAAVIEALDQIADRNWEQFEAARDALLVGSDEELRQLDADPRWRAEAARLRAEHATLLDALLAGKANPRDVRIQLVHYYADKGCRELDERMFPEHP